MPMPEAVEIKRDMLSATSSVQAILRALYFYGANYLMVRFGKRERLVHKEQLVALLEQGRERATVEDLPALSLAEPLAAKMQPEDIDPDLPLLLYFQETEAGEGELSRTTFAEYRERKLVDALRVLPEWWGIPLPLLHVEDDEISLNEAALALIPGGTPVVAAQFPRAAEERLLTIRDRRRERTFALSPLAEGTFLIEDISGDFEMAEDLVWWAAVGKAFVRRMECNGIAVHRLAPEEAPPAGAAEVIPCEWEGENIGRLVVIVPPEVEKRREQRVPDAESEPERAAQTSKPQDALPPAELVTATAAEEAPEDEASPQLPVNREAARKAYGGRGLNPSLKTASEGGKTGETRRNGAKKTGEKGGASKPRRKKADASPEEA